MNRKFILSSVIALSFAVVSCQKEVETTEIDGADIKGAWRFINFNVKTSATIEASDGAVVMKTVTTSEYTSENNSGTVTIDANNISYNNLSYSMKATAYATIYENGVKIDTASFPMEASIPSMTNTFQYKRVGSDSLYFQSGSSFLSGGTQATNASGAKFKLEQNKLSIIQNVHKSETVTEQGQTAKSIQTAVVIVNLQKQ